MKKKGFVIGSSIERPVPRVAAAPLFSIGSTETDQDRWFARDNRTAGGQRRMGQAGLRILGGEGE
jgi:hypothetical protein